MAKLESISTIEADRWWVHLSTDYNKRLVEAIKQFPGRQWLPDAKVWKIPIEVYPWLAMVFDIPKIGSQVLPKPIEKKIDKLFDYQEKAVARILNDGAHLVAFEAGLGKTLVAIELFLQLKERGLFATGPGLVVTQASLVPQWKVELDTYNLSQYVIVSSYEGMKKLPPNQWVAIVLDESQNIANPKAQRTQHAHKLATEHPRAFRVCLSATPIPDDPKDVWASLEFLFPGRFGKHWNFCEHYCNKEIAYDNETGEELGSSFWGLKKENATELGQRLAAVGSFVAKDDVPYVLPKITISRIDTDDPVGEAARLATPNSAIFTWHRSMAREIAETLGVTPIMGDTPQKKRAQIVVPGKPVVATAGSMGVGTNYFLTRDDAIIAELHWSAKFFSQTIGRFARIGGSDVNLKVLVTKQTDTIAMALERKLEAIRGAKPLSLSEKLATTALEQTDYKTRLASLRMADEDDEG